VPRPGRICSQLHLTADPALRAVYTGRMAQRAITASSPSVLGKAILQLLERRSLCGYDLKKRFAETLAIGWHAHDSQIYPELKRLERLGLLRSWTEPGTSGPPRRMYAITPCGHAVLVAWLESPLEDDTRQKNELMLRIWSSDLMAPEALDRLLADVEAQTRAHLLKLLALRARMHERHGAPETVANPHQVGVMLCLDHDIRLAQAKLAWVEQAGLTIAARAAGASRDGRAAGGVRPA
jgi:PadR family transcriptional regulator, regulatory protein AphA